MAGRWECWRERLTPCECDELHGTVKLHPCGLCAVGTAVRQQYPACGLMLHVAGHVVCSLDGSAVVIVDGMWHCHMNVLRYVLRAPAVPTAVPIL